MNTTRRSFLGGLAIVAAPAQAETDARSRADHHYAEFVRAMNEITAEYDGWDIHARMRRPTAGRDAVDHKQVSVVRFDVVSEPPMVFERHEAFCTI